MKIIKKILRLLPFILTLFFAITLINFPLPDTYFYETTSEFVPYSIGNLWTSDSELTILNVYNKNLNSYRYHYVLSSTTEFAVYWNAERQQYYLEIVRPGGYEAHYTDIVPGEYILFNATLIDIEKTDFYKSPLGIPPQSITKETTNDIEIISSLYCEYIDNFIGFNIPVFENFYNVYIYNVFGGYSPIILKPIFNILIYELILSMFFIFFDFINLFFTWCNKFLKKGTDVD